MSATNLHTIRRKADFAFLKKESPGSRGGSGI